MATIDTTADGTDFLKVDGDPPELVDNDKALVNNYLTTVGGAKPKRGTEESKRYFVDKVMGALESAAKWTGNRIQDVACCVDAKTIKDWDIDRANYRPPPYQMNGNNLQHLFLQHVEKCYHKYHEK